MSELFDVSPFEVIAPPVIPAEKLSATQRLTVRNNTALAIGKHPANGLPIDDSHTCGECVNLKRYRLGKTYLKCAFHRLGESHSAASDMRAGWPACPHWESCQ